MLEHFAEVGAGDNPGGVRALSKSAQGGAQQPHAICCQRALAEFIDDAEGPAASQGQAGKLVKRGIAVLTRLEKSAMAAAQYITMCMFCDLMPSGH